MNEIAIFAAGCFWHVEAAFQRAKGVVSTRVGYTGGTVPSPTYEQVCGHGTGHAEAVEVTYDPSRLTYDQLLDLFWSIHDPTTRNRQGPDVGSQYRSSIFVSGPEQEMAARASRDRLEKSGKLRRSIVTEIVLATQFWQAEEYHQRYFEKTGRESCAL